MLLVNDHRKQNVLNSVAGTLVWWMKLTVRVVCVLQIVIIQIGGYAFATAALDIDHWMWCFFFGVGVLIWGQVSGVSVTNDNRAILRLSVTS